MNLADNHTNTTTTNTQAFAPETTVTTITVPTHHAEDDGPRIKHFRLALHKMLQATIKSCSSIDKIEQQFPSSLTNDQLVLIQDLLKKELETSYKEINKPVNDLLEERNLPSLLNAVDRFIRVEGDKTPQAILPNFEGVQNAIDSYLIPSQLEELERIEKMSNALEESNKLRGEALSIKKAEISSRLQRLQDAKDLSLASFNQMSKIRIPELDALVDRMHQHNN